MSAERETTDMAPRAFAPDYRNIVDAARNRRPKRLPLYEHIICPEIMETILEVEFLDLHEGDGADLRAYFARYCQFFREMTYDTVSYEVCVGEVLPGGGALLHPSRGSAITSRAEFDAYPWDDLPQLYWKRAAPRFEALAAVLPAGMKAVGGVGNGIFEIAQDLVGYENLCFLMIDDPELFAELMVRIGEVHVTLWSEFLPRFGDAFAVCRIGDDLGFKTSTLLQPDVLLAHVIPQYRRVIQLVHDAGLPYLQHSCGRIFSVMDAWIEAGIDAKHSNEDAVAPYDEWIEHYGDRIGLFGGIDTDRLCRMAPDDLFEFVLDAGARFRRDARGYALGSGNSIPDYVPVDGYLAMIRAGGEIRARESKGAS